MGESQLGLPTRNSECLDTDTQQKAHKIGNTTITTSDTGTRQAQLDQLDSNSNPKQTAYETSREHRLGSASRDDATSMAIPASVLKAPRCTKGGGYRKPQIGTPTRSRRATPNTYVHKNKNPKKIMKLADRNYNEPCSLHNKPKKQTKTNHTPKTRPYIEGQRTSSSYPKMLEA